MSKRPTLREIAENLLRQGVLHRRSDWNVFARFLLNRENEIVLDAETDIGTKGKEMLAAETQDEQLAALGAGETGEDLFKTGTQADARAAIGMTAAGAALATAADAEAQADLLAAYISGGGVGDTDSYVIAQPGDNLATKYAAAKALTPNSAALSATNRAALVLMPGVYTLAAELAADTNYVDVIGLGAGEFTPAVEFADNTINVTAWDIRVVGISVGSQQFNVSPRPNITGVTGTASNNRIIIANHGLRVGDVISFSALTGGTGLSTNVRYVVGSQNYSSGEFRLILESTGGFVTFSTDVTTGTLMIEANGSQRFDICTGGDFSFGGSGTASGTFTNCTGGDFSFGGSGGTASGTFTNCTGGKGSFGGSGTASGTFTNCTGGDFPFGGYDGTASGTFTNCTGGNFSFGGGFGTLSGKCYSCRLASGTFETVSGGGITRLCIDGNNAENNQG